MFVLIAGQSSPFHNQFESSSGKLELVRCPPLFIDLDCVQGGFKQKRDRM